MGGCSYFWHTYGFGCQNSCSSWSNLQENTTKVFHEGGPNSMKVDLHREWSWKQNSKSDFNSFRGAGKIRMIVYYAGSDWVFVKVTKRFVQTGRFQLHEGCVMLNNCSRWSWSLKIRNIVINVN